MGGNNSRNLEPGQQLALQLQQAKRQMAGVGLIFRKTDDGKPTSLQQKTTMADPDFWRAGRIALRRPLEGAFLPIWFRHQCWVLRELLDCSQIDGTKISKCALDEISGMILGDPGDA
eukprot:2699666-Rhodomonas_salina.2